MAACARCSVDIGAGGIQQEDGSRLCGACDLRLHAPQKPAAGSGLAVPTFCPKCSAVWDRNSTACSKCNWDIVMQRHVDRPIKKKYYRISVDPGSIALAVIVLVGGYLCYDYYQTQKAEAKRDATRQELRQKEAEAHQARLEAERKEAAELARRDKAIRDAEYKQKLEEKKRKQTDLSVTQLTQDMTLAFENLQKYERQKVLLESQIEGLTMKMESANQQQQTINKSMIDLTNASNSSQNLQKLQSLKTALDGAVADYQAADISRAQLTPQLDEALNEIAKANAALSFAKEQLTELGIDPATILGKAAPVVELPGAAK